MKIQTRIKRYAWLALGVAALLPVSCIKDDYAGRESATVTMTFTTRADVTAQAANGSLEDNEQMTTLRVIVARSSDDEILFNNVYSIAPEENQKTITYSELTINENGEDFDFYAIANESAFETTSGELSNIVSSQLDDLHERILNKDFNENNASGIIPQAAFKTITVKPQAGGGIQKENMQLQFPVGKVCVTFVNTTGNEVTLTDVRMDEVAPNQAYLFYQGTPPGGTTLNGSLVFAEELSIATGTEAVPYTTEVITRYIYPGAKGAGNYKLTAEWNDTKYEVVLATADGDIANIARGQQINVTVTLKSNGGFFVKCVPQDWFDQSHDYELSDVGHFSITQPNMRVFELADDIKRFATQYVEGADAQSRQLVFTLQMTSPEGVRWQAHLTNAQDFEFVGASEGVGGGDPVTLHVRPTKIFDATGARPETELYVTIGTSEEMQVFDNDLNYAGDGQRLHIVQVSASEWANTTDTQP